MKIDNISLILNLVPLSRHIVKISRPILIFGPDSLIILPRLLRIAYSLIGLTDCMINQVNPILRTDLLRAMYKKVFAMKEALNIHWHGTLDQVLFPIDYQFYDDLAYRSSIRNAGSMKELYRAIKRGTDEMFDILSLEYVFYCPWIGG